jgi:hypothetical protein
MLSIAAGTTTKSQINLVSGVAPTSPNAGDIWYDGTYINTTVAQQISRSSLGSTISSSLYGSVLINPTAATSTQSQYSPGLTFSANGWSTTSAASQNQTVMIGLETSSSTTNPNANLVFSFMTNGGSWNTAFAFSYAATNWTFGAAGLTINPVGGAGISLTSLPATANQFHYATSFTFEQVGALTTSSPGYGTTFINGSGATTQTSGNNNQYQFVQSFSPTSGTGTFALLALQPTINQTGGASGISRGLYIQPTLTAAANFHAIEVALGISLFAAATTSYASINLPSGTAPTSPNVGDMWVTGGHLYVCLTAGSGTLIV